LRSTLSQLDVRRIANPENVAQQYGIAAVSAIPLFAWNPVRINLFSPASPHPAA
jgi:hypothetical protein